MDRGRKIRREWIVIAYNSVLIRMSPIDWWLLLLLLFNSSLLCYGSGNYSFCLSITFESCIFTEPEKCVLRFDEISTVRAESTIHGAPTDEHSYYLALRFDNCEETDHPKLGSYSIAIVRLTEGESAPRQIAFFDLRQHSPLMQISGKFNWVR